MRKIFTLLAWLGFIALLSPHAYAIKPYPVSYSDIVKVKKVLDDPRPFLTDSQYYKIWIPDEAWNQLTFDQETMKSKWADVVGFKAPEVTGKIEPGIKPGVYKLADKHKYAFDRLMPPGFYQKWNKPGEGGVNHVGNFTEFELIPTRQYYWNIPIAEATKKFAGSAKQDENGYMVPGTYKGGYPFPRPAGPHKGIQMMYNWEYRYGFGEDGFVFDLTNGVDKNWKQDHTGVATSNILRTAGRVWTEPFGIIDKQAEKNNQLRLWLYSLTEPRDFYGNVYLSSYYTDPNKPTSILAYVNILRRIRKLSSSDKQDQAVGQDLAFDDADGFSQALSPVHYPYEYKVIADREFLVFSCTQDGAEWIDSKNKYEWKGLRLERRPTWVLEMTQLDPNYIYSKRIFYIDKETLMPYRNEFYDQKGRLYRTFTVLYSHVPPMGTLSLFQLTNADHIDVHSTFSFVPSYPALWLDRSSVSLVKMMKGK